MVARTDPTANPSARVLEKAGFVHEGEVADAEIGRAWRFSYRRDRS